MAHFNSVKELEEYAEKNNISKESEAYKNSVWIVRDYQNALLGAKIEGFLEGYAQVRNISEETLTEKIRTVQRCKKLGLAIEQIATITDLGTRAVEIILQGY